MPTEKYAHAPEILEHCRRIGQQFGLYDNALFHTEVTDLEWDDGALALDHPHQPRRRVHGAVRRPWAPGPLHVPEAARHPRHRDVPRPLVPHEPVGLRLHRRRPERRADGQARRQAGRDHRHRRDGGAVRPAPRAACQELYVFQRTPSSVDVRDNRPTDPRVVRGDRDAGLAAALARELHRRSRRAMLPDEDLVQDGWTDLARRVREQDHGAAGARSSRPRGCWRAFEDSDFEKMEEIRARVDTIVEDPATAQKLKAWYRQLCKRPCFHDEYLQAFNEPGTQLVDTDGKGVERITETGVVVAGVEYEVDCIIYASGFEVGTTHTRRMGFDPVGRDGVRLSDVLGRRHAHQARHARARLPEPLHRAAAQGANLISNVPHNLTEAGQDDRDDRAARALDAGTHEVEVTEGGGGRLARAPALGPGQRSSARPTARPATTTTRASRRSPAATSFVGYPARRDGVLPVPRRVAHVRATSRASSSARLERGEGSPSHGRTSRLHRIRGAEA